jgi:hypothetical protein
MASVAALALSAQAAEIARREFQVSGAQVLMLVVSALVTAVCIAIHYEVMSWSSRLLPRRRLRRRNRIVVLILAMLAGHIVEVWVFGLTYWGLDRWPALGQLSGPFEEGALDFIYFSVTAFTTLGFGDIVPTGAVRILTGTEALVGLGLITWSASLAFLEMQRDWGEFRRRASESPLDSTARDRS